MVYLFYIEDDAMDHGLFLTQMSANSGLVGLFLFYWLLLLIDNQSVLLPPEDEFDEYVANFLPYFFFGEK